MVMPDSGGFDDGFREVARFLRKHRQPVADLLLAFLCCWSASAIYFTHDAVLLHYGAALPLSSDNVAPYLLFDDLFRRHLSLSGWMFPEAPFFVPDIALGWIAYALGGSLIGAVNLYALVSSVLFAWLVRQLLVRAGYPASAWHVWLVLWLSGIAVGVYAPPDWLSHLYGYIFIPYMHSGTLLAVAAGFLLLADDDPARTRRNSAILVLLSAVLLISDRLFVLQFLLPALVLALWRRFAYRELRFGPVALMIAAIVIAGEALRALGGAQFATESNDRVPVALSLAAIARDLGGLARRDPINTTLMAAGFVATLLALRPQARADAATAVGVLRQRSLAAFVLLSVLIPLAATLALGRYHSLEELRYVQTVPLLCLPLVGMIALRVERGALGAQGLRFSSAIVVLAAVLLPLLAGFQRTGLDYLDDQEACLRRAIAREHLALGAATYWRANEMTARFADGPVIVPLSVDVAPRMRNIVDLAWLDPLAEGASLPALTFVDESGYSAAQLDRAFGPSTRRVECPRSAYRLYRPEDGALARLYRSADWLPSQLLQRVRVAVVPAAAWATESTFVDGDAIHATGVHARPTPVLATAIDIPKGALDVDLAYAYSPVSADAAVHWAVAIVNDEGVPLAEIGTGVLDRTNAGRVRLPLAERPETGDILGFSIAVQGTLDLRVQSVRIAVH